MPLPDLLDAIRPFVDRQRFDLDDDTLLAAVAATRTHFVTFADVNEQLEEFFPSDRTMQLDSPVIAAALTTLGGVPEWNEESLRAALQDIGRASGLKGRALYEPLRRALTGREHGPPLGAVCSCRAGSACWRR
jgi:glutamyl/glutaminyl-tRNA synthetase